jgi:glycosyltransferase involved in cell wall biosynthesis
MVSVVTAVYNGARFLRESIDSILAQTCDDFEFIIVDDGSTDDTRAVLDCYTDARIVRLRNERNIGLTRSLNRGLALARGSFVARHDADDVGRRHRLEAQLQFFEGHRDVGLLGAAYDVIDAMCHHVASYTPPQCDTAIRWQQLFHNAFCHSTVMFRRDLLTEDVPGYDERIRCAQDYALWSHLLQYTRGANLAESLVCYRTHDGAIAATHRIEQQRTASEIAARNMHSLAPDLRLSIEEVAELRQWFNGFPEAFDDWQLTLCTKLRALLAAFTNRADVDRGEVDRIVSRWSRRIDSAVRERASEVTA